MNLFPIIYGLLTLAGGIMGYVKAGSTASLMAGGISGILILVCAMLYLQKKPLGLYGLTVLSLALAGWFGLKFSQSGAIMPAGMMVALSVLNLCMIWLGKKTPQAVSE